MSKVQTGQKEKEKKRDSYHGKDGSKLSALQCHCLKLRITSQNMLGQIRIKSHQTPCNKTHEQTSQTGSLETNKSNNNMNGLGISNIQENVTPFYMDLLPRQTIDGMHESTEVVKMLRHKTR